MSPTKQSPVVPPLEHNCISWMIVHRATGKAVLETYSLKMAKAINQEAYEVLTALQYLQRFNDGLLGVHQ